MRKQGFYWVKMHGKWMVAEYANASFWLSEISDFPGGHNDDDFDQIGNRILTPDEIDSTEPYKGHIIAR